MPLIAAYSEAKETYQQAAELGVAIPAFCAEDRETLEAILSATLEMGKELGVEDLPIAPSWTCRYPGRPQMRMLTACGDPMLGTQLMLSDLRMFMGESSPYRRLRVLPHLDHAFPWLDADVLESCADEFASVMCDASEKPFEENILLTAQYTDRVRGRVLVEGAVDEVFEAGSGVEIDEPTTVERARRFLSATGVDLVVPNVGTEHRATIDTLHYRSDRAREISAAFGKILCLHGTSSLRQAELSDLPSDGFVKVNVFTTLAVRGGQALARHVLRDLGNVFEPEQLRGMVTEGILGEAVLAPDYGASVPPQQPKLSHLVNAPRRDAWFGAVRDRCTEFLKVFNYHRYAG